MHLLITVFAAPFSAASRAIFASVQREGRENSEETLYRLADFVKQNLTFAHVGLCSHRSSSVSRESAVKMNAFMGRSDGVPA